MFNVNLSLFQGTSVQNTLPRTFLSPTRTTVQLFPIVQKKVAFCQLYNSTQSRVIRQQHQVCWHHHCLLPRTVPWETFLSTARALHHYLNRRTIPSRISLKWTTPTLYFILLVKKVTYRRFPKRLMTTRLCGISKILLSLLDVLAMLVLGKVCFSWELFSIKLYAQHMSSFECWI